MAGHQELFTIELIPNDLGTSFQFNVFNEDLALCFMVVLINLLIDVWGGEWEIEDIGLIVLVYARLELSDIVNIDLLELFGC